MGDTAEQFSVSDYSEIPDTYWLSIN